MQSLTTCLFVILLGAPQLGQTREAGTPATSQVPSVALAFLIGEWKAEGGGSPGRSVGEFSFVSAADGRALIRKNEAISSSGRHSDVMLVYVSSDAELRALYTDSEGHTIDYNVAIDQGLQRVVFESSAPGPRFRLWYQSNQDGSLATGFQIAQPGSSDFKTYLEGVARRK